MRLFNVLRKPKYLAIAVVSSLVFAGVYIYTQVLGIIENIDLWLSVIPLHNAILFVVFDVLFGITLSYQLYVRREPRVCDVKKGTAAGGAGTFLTFLVAQCPACASLGALFLPVSAVTFFTAYSAWINLVGIGLLLFTLNYLGAFKK